MQTFFAIRQSVGKLCNLKMTLHLDWMQEMKWALACVRFLGQCWRCSRCGDQARSIEWGCWAVGVEQRRIMKSKRAFMTNWLNIYNRYSFSDWVVENILYSVDKNRDMNFKVLYCPWDHYCSTKSFFTAEFRFLERKWRKEKFKYLNLLWFTPAP